MSNPTTPFGWQMPTATDLVTDLPADFEVFGQAVATSMSDLLGGTSGQILAKNSNTDMDFVWIANDQGDITGVTATSPLTGGGTSGAITVGIQDALTTQKGAVQLSDSTSTTSSILAATPTAVKSAYDLADAAIAKSTVTTAGDIIYRNATVPVRLGIGTAGQVLTVNSGATAPQWSSPSVFATNLLLNSNFALNQRTYVSAANLASGTYGFDRWKSNYTNTTLTFTASTQGQSLTISASGGLQQVIEQGLVPAGTYTLSWTGTATGRVYNSGGTPPSYAASPVTFTADGTANVVVEFTAVSTTKTLSKVQFNAGTNTTWYLATPTLQTELAACQRYYYRLTADATNPAPIYGFGTGTAATSGRFGINLLATMRTTPSSIDFNSLGMSDGVNATTGITALALLTNGTATNNCGVNATTASGITTYRPYFIVGNGASGAYLGVNAEL
jgi:hypothetical protein